MPPLVPYNKHTPEEWQLILQDGLGRHDQQQVSDAVSALNQYSQESVDATKLSSIPGELSAIGSGLKKGLVGVPEGLAQIAGDLAGGHFGRAAGDVGKGIVGTAENVAGVLEPAMHNLAVAIQDRTDFDPNAEYTPESITRQRIEGAASTLPALGAADVAGRLAGPTLKGAAKTVAGGATGLIGGTLGRVLRGLRGLGEAGGEESGGAAPSGNPTSPSPVIDPNVVDLTRGAERTPAPTPVQDVNLPRGGPSVPGYMPNTAPTPEPPGMSMEAQLGQMARGSPVQGLMSNVDPLESIRARSTGFFDRSNTAQIAPTPASATPAQPPSTPLTDALRQLSDEDLAKQPMGQTPPVEQSALAQPKPPEPLPTDIIARELQRANPTQWIGTGPESITPADLAKTSILGEAEQAPIKPAAAESVAKPAGKTTRAPRSSKSATFAKGTRPEFKSNVLQVLGEIAKAIQDKQALY